MRGRPKEQPSQHIITNSYVSMSCTEVVPSGRPTYIWLRQEHIVLGSSTSLNVIDTLKRDGARAKKWVVRVAVAIVHVALGSCR